MSEINDLIIQSLSRLEDKVDKIQEDTQEIRVIQTRNTSDLEYHIKRTDLLEKQMTDTNKTQDSRLHVVELNVKKFGKLDDRVKYTITLVAAIGAVITFLKTMGLF